MGRYNLADGNPARASADAHVIRQMRMHLSPCMSRRPTNRIRGTRAAAEHSALNPAAH